MVVSPLTTSSMLVPEPYMASAIALSGDGGNPPAAISRSTTSASSRAGSSKYLALRPARCRSPSVSCWYTAYSVS
jgi:hypothetical protein